MALAGNARMASAAIRRSLFISVGSLSERAWAALVGCRHN
jgi:hypothetical protein